MARRTIGEVANIIGVTPKAIRVWEEKGLLLPAERSEQGYRTYGDADIELMRVIRQGKLLGLSLSDLKDVIVLHRSGLSPCSRVLAAIDARVAKIDVLVEELQAERQCLIGLRASAQAEPPQSSRVTLCSIIERSMELPSCCAAGGACCDRGNDGNRTDC